VALFKLLAPVTENSPAHVKDSGVIGMVKAGMAAYNAKSGELLLLPSGEAKRRRIEDGLAAALFGKRGFQNVGCGSDEAIFSVAERYVRDWRDAATSFCEGRGRNLRIIAWRGSEESAAAEAEAVMETVTAGLSGLGVTGLSFLEIVKDESARRFVLAAKCGPGSIGASPGFVCPICGSVKFPDSPIDFVPPHPGSGEPEETIEDIETPGANTIIDLCAQLRLGITRTIKAMLYVAYDSDSRRNAVASFVRGDYNLSMSKLGLWLRRERSLTGLRPADKQELHELIGEVAGYCGPVGLPSDVTVVCDWSVSGAINTVAGANRPGYHKKGCCHPRDFDPAIADIAQLTSGTPCECGGKYEETFLRETGNIEVKRLSGAHEDGIKILSCRDREGAREYPAVLSGELSTERLLLAGI